MIALLVLAGGARADLRTGADTDAAFVETGPAASEAVPVSTPPDEPGQRGALPGTDADLPVPTGQPHGDDVAMIDPAPAMAEVAGDEAAPPTAADAVDTEGAEDAEMVDLASEDSLAAGAVRATGASRRLGLLDGNLVLGDDRVGLDIRLGLVELTVLSLGGVQQLGTLEDPQSEAVQSAAPAAIFDRTEIPLGRFLLALPAIPF